MKSTHTSPVNKEADQYRYFGGNIVKLLRSQQIMFQNNRHYIVNFWSFISNPKPIEVIPEDRYQILKMRCDKIDLKMKDFKSLDSLFLQIDKKENFLIFEKLKAEQPNFNNCINENFKKIERYKHEIIHHKRKVVECSHCISTHINAYLENKNPHLEKVYHLTIKSEYEIERDRHQNRIAELQKIMLDYDNHLDSLIAYWRTQYFGKKDYELYPIASQENSNDTVVDLTNEEDNEGQEFNVSQTTANTEEVEDSNGYEQFLQSLLNGEIVDLDLNPNEEPAEKRQKRNGP